MIRGPALLLSAIIAMVAAQGLHQTPLIAGCGRANEKRAPEVRATATSVTVGPVTAGAPVGGPMASAASSAAAEPTDRTEEFLLRARLFMLAATPRKGVRPGLFEAYFERGSSKEGAPTGRAELSLKSGPTAYKASLAFSRLGRALDTGVVPITVYRRLTLDELASVLDADTFRHQIVVQNDGTVDALLASRAGRSAGSPWDEALGAPIDVSADGEVATWQRWARAPAPAPGEDGALLRSYVEMLVLDYLAANVARREVLRTAHALVLADNGSAFPPHVDRPTLDRMLRRLREVARFPRGLRAALRSFDRAHAAETFAAGGFEAWLLSPRALIELDERRAALLTLVEARVTDRGAEAVLAL